MMKISALLLLVCLCAAAASADDAAVMNLNENYSIDALGNGSVTVDMDLSASQYMQWKQRYGLNPSLLKRDMGKLVSQYDMTDFDVDQKDMQRQVSVTMKLRGVMRYKGDGTFEMDIPKTWQGGTRHDNAYEFHYAETPGPGQIMQHNVRLTVPPAADQFSEQLGEQGDKVISYHLPVSTGRSALPLIAGIVLLVVGIAAAAMGFVLPKSA